MEYYTTAELADKWEVSAFPHALQHGYGSLQSTCRID